MRVAMQIEEQFANLENLQDFLAEIITDYVNNPEVNNPSVELSTVKDMDGTFLGYRVRVNWEEER